MSRTDLAIRRWAEPGVAWNAGVTQGIHVRAILVDPCVYLIGSADGPVAGDEDIDVARRAFEQPQCGEVVLDRFRGVVQVEHRNQDIRKHVAGDENAAFLDQQRRMARGMPLMLDDPDLRAIPGNLRRLGGQAISEPYIPASTSNTPARPCTTTALLWQNSLWWISTPSATCLSTGGSFRLVVCTGTPGLLHYELLSNRCFRDPWSQ